MINENTLYWLWLAEKCGIGSKLFDGLVEKYENPFDIYRLEESEIAQLSGVTEKLREKLCEKNLDESYNILKYCKQNNIDIIAYGDKQYPERLKNIEDPPIVLYCMGHFPNFDSLLCVGIVGTRKMSEYGKQSAYKIAYELAAADVLTVSGMALGIDGVSECGALAAGGRTVAVLGCGIKTVYPKAHVKLAREIVRHGAIITEFPPDEAPYAHNFPRRNRIISGLCQAVLVVEAAEKSGALITAECAIGQGKEVFALPGKISDEGAKGTNSLIKRGAYTALSSADILSHYQFLYGDVTNMAALKRIGDKSERVEEALARYGLDYALETESLKEEKIFYPARGGKKKKAEDSQESEKPSKKAEKAEKSEKAQKVQKREQEIDASTQSGGMSDESAAFLASLDSATRAIFESLPDGRAVSLDELAGGGQSVTELLTALTLLEVGGLVSSLPGGLYIRK